MKKYSTKNLLIILVKNTDLGHVKTRLAKTLGDENALMLYIEMLKHTHKEVSKIEADKSVHYSTYIDKLDLFTEPTFSSHLQLGDDLGERMQNAFEMGFNQGFKNVIIIGSDCWELKSEILENAFTLLENSDHVLGPAKDGGYYLHGMSSPFYKVFQDKKWSTENVLVDAILDIKNANRTYALLETLSDIDHEEDLPSELRVLVKR